MVAPSSLLAAQILPDGAHLPDEPHPRLSLRCSGGHATVRRSLLWQSLYPSKATSGSLTAEQAEALLHVLEHLIEPIEAEDAHITHQNAYLADAMRIYKRYTHWPKHTSPNPAQVMAWLLDFYSGRKQAAKMLAVLQELNTRLGGLGKLDFDQTYRIPGSFLIGLRAQVINILTIIRMDPGYKLKEKQPGS